MVQVGRSALRALIKASAALTDAVAVISCTEPPPFNSTAREDSTNLGFAKNPCKALAAKYSRLVNPEEQPIAVGDELRSSRREPAEALQSLPLLRNVESASRIGSSLKY